MKRKHGNKKGKSKEHRVDGTEEVSKTIESVDVEDNSDSEDDQDNDEPETPVVAEPSSSTVAEPSSSTVAEQPVKPAFVLPERPIQKPVTTAVYGRVKLRLKAPKTVEPKVASADVPIHSDTHSSSGHQKSVDKQDLVMDKVEDSANSLPDAGTAAVENPPGKAESIKIISSNVLIPSSTDQDADADAAAEKEDKLQHDDALEPKLPDQGPQYNKKELDDALEVIKKVMKMEAAEPFNVPVNPIELGIPDYFDVIDTPMDFGTIRKNLESGTKYINSESVYKDVQYIWNNCFKYNNKGDFIVDLMKRVKKNFSKYWLAAGLFSDQPRKGNGAEGIIGSDGGGSSSHEKKLKKGKGVKKHKDGCLCAICIMKRRRKEREAREAQDNPEGKVQDSHTPSGISDPNLSQGGKSEENALMDNQGGEEISSSVENSQDADGDEEVEDVTEEMQSEAAGMHNSAQNAEENKLDNHDAPIDVSEAPQEGHRSENGSYLMSDPKLMSDSGPVTKADTEKRQPVYIEEHTSSLQKRKIELIEAEKQRQKSQLYESLCQLESPALLGLCKTLFPENQNTVWEGPHSLLHRKKPRKDSDILAAVSSFMRPPSKSSL